MSTTTVARPLRADATRPALAALFGALVFALTMTLGDVLDLQSDTADTGLAFTELLTYVGLVLVAVSVATWLGARAWAGPPQRLARTALGLAVAAAVTFVGFWSGWPEVFGAVAVALALEHRRRVGSFSVTTLIALVLGGLALVLAGYLCVTG